MCADPRNILAAESCCKSEGSGSQSDAVRFCKYNGERMKYSSAVDRCSKNGQEQCNPKRFGQGLCMDGQEKKIVYSWSKAGCVTRAKIYYKATYMIARVDFPDPDWAGKRYVRSFVGDGTFNYFKVAWNGEVSAPNDSSSCDSKPSCYSVVDGCICDTNVVETTAFPAGSDITSKDDILKTLRIGAFSPAMFDAGDYKALGDCGVPGGVKIYSKTSGGCSSLKIDTIFKVVDNYGVERYLKNMISNVEIKGIANLSFRNPVHVVDLVNRSLRDIHYEVDAVIDTYFYHPNHAPFLALRLIQRFGNSNPSPKYIERVSIAYTKGSYMGRFGSGKYGDMAAMIAAVLLDAESRSVSLDADPSHGHIREPLIKYLSFFRSMNGSFNAPMNVPRFKTGGMKRFIGQGPYGVKDVFSFFPPEFVPSGPIAAAGLVSPETHIMNGAYVTNLLDGIFSTVKFGLSFCSGGVGFNDFC
mmetsp:Transcript_36280/g.71395  ORF Transcript_36280/g.71395 Transcript_36280/m.71395 type:complete len:470 (+) Transcript_36280:3-1412(+)